MNSLEWNIDQVWAYAMKLEVRLDELRAEVELWKDRAAAERRAHEATIKHFHDILNEPR